MSKDEYLKLYQEWTNTNDRARSQEIVDAIAQGAVEELEKLEEVYDKCGMPWKSPLNQQCDGSIDLEQIDRIMLDYINSCEVKLSLHDDCYKKLQSVILNVKWFGDDARFDLANSLIEAAIRECDETISEQQDQIKCAIKRAEDNIRDAQKKKAEFEAKLAELNKKILYEGKTE